MPLTWDIDEALSREAVFMHSLASALSETAGFRRLNNESTAEQALTKVKIGPPMDEWEGTTQGKALKEQLQELVVRASLRPSEDNPMEATEADRECPNEGGTIELEIVRFLSDDEAEDLTEQEQYLAFLDCTSSIAHDLVQAMSMYNRVPKVRITSPAGFAARDAQSSRGVSLGVSMEVDWGDRGGDGGGEQ
jgi:hypothetical protein